MEEFPDDDGETNTVRGAAGGVSTGTRGEGSRRERVSLLSSSSPQLQLQQGEKTKTASNPASYASVGGGRDHA